MSLVKILIKPISGKKTPLAFIGDGNSSEATFGKSWDYLASNREPLEIKFDRVNLYNALRGYLDEKGVSYKPQGEVSTDFLLRLDEDKDILTAMKFLGDVKKYNQLENRSHSGDERKGLDEFKEQLGKYASKYR